MRRLGLVVIIFLLLVLPLIIFSLKNKDTITHAYNMLRVSSRQKSPAYSAVSQVKDHSLTLPDTAYLDYIAAQLGIFDDQGVINPESLFDKEVAKTRHTVSSMRVELAPIHDRYIVGISGNDLFAGTGTYSIDGNTLVVSVALNFNDSLLSAGPHSVKEVFLDVLYQTLYFAHGAEPGDIFTEGFRLNKKNIKEYLHTGIFAWPVDIQRL